MDAVAKAWADEAAERNARDIAKWTPPKKPEKRRYTYTVAGLEGEDFELRSNFSPTSVDYLAEEAAEDFYNNHDGWEWHWPADFEVFLDGQSLGRRRVETEAVMSFRSGDVP